ncbi:MAG: 2,3-bisphosphoglycerate-independent phosphoglycerate mutase [Patescibacteria group bacterium]
MNSKKPIALIILDGFGIAPANQTNAISIAGTPFLNSLLENYPFMLLEASGLAVGLPRGEVGNSEVGHMSIGSGILKYQSLPRIDRSISTGQFFKNKILLDAFLKAKKNDGDLHLMGLVSNGGVHSSVEHLEALLEMAKTLKVKKNIFIHIFLDGRDTARDLGKKFVAEIIKYTKNQKTAKIASLCGRFYAMDRNNNWDRIEKAYRAIAEGIADNKARDPLKAIEESYKKEIFDEEFLPTVITDRRGNPITKIKNNDSVIFFNFRADRARQLTECFINSDFSEFKVNKYQNLDFISFTEYKKDFKNKILFETEIIENPLAKVFSENNLSQLHIAETEKYAHVTFFLNGMTEEKFKNEDRILIPSPDVISYDQKPEMSATEVTTNILNCVRQDKYDFYAINFANPDMVGHTGNLDATIKAIQTVDDCLKKIIPEIVKKNGTVYLVSDHGNSEELINLATGEIDKEHNNHPVPFLVIGNRFVGQNILDIKKIDISLLTPVGILADIAPTILKHAGLEIPNEMTGKPLL